MLSAIAARKAAQAARQDVTNHALRPPTPTPPPPETTAAIKPTPKRKSSSQSTKPAKRKKEKRTPGKAPRYFTEPEPDTFQEQDDVIVIESDEEVLSEDVETPEPTAGRGRWSPSVPLNDSSDEEDDVPFSVLASTKSPLGKVESPDVLSTFLPVPSQNTFILNPEAVAALHIDDDTRSKATIVALKPEETLCLLGTYTFSVLQGSITHSGVTIPSSPRSHRVFAPRSSPLPVLEGVDGVSAISNIRQLPEALHSLIGSPIALVLLQELRTGVEGLGRICRTFDGVFEPSRWQSSVASPDLQLSGVQMVTSQTRDIRPFDVPVSWARALSSVSTAEAATVHFVKGPKKSGKSTFARTLVNSLLTRYQKVAYLECDLGQSEFTPGGMVALNVISNPLFGPPFAHPTLPHRAHYIGATTPRSSPSHYLAAIQSALETYRLDIQTPAISPQDDDERISDAIPLVINTMGWYKGLGADLTLKIQDMACPTDIYEIEAPFDPAWPAAPTTPFPTPPAAYLASESQARTHTLQPIQPSVLSTNYSAADHRALALMSYFYADFSTSPPSPVDELPQLTATTWRTSLPLVAQPPYEVDASRMFDNVVLTGAGTEDVVPTEVGRVLNGAIVGLVACEPGTLDLDMDATETASASAGGIPYMQGAAPPSPATSTCHGLALLRSVSPTSAQVHVLTPLPPRLLATARVLVKGELELPVWGMLDFRSESGEEVAGVERGRVPYLQWGKGEGVGGERRRVRRNLMRKGQM
ncbi:putative mRNA cleavage and polyadenylation factor CLP1 P-loop [Lyophyllum shimeji]|uniref:Polynucleotide 5'-hydroxyl-kinase GRC3 n=1 Tax=Lyophyllum shimeji TaxID=47721 RepID=A0A9P3UH40_LYOSH|nr:putative mRNA cleavage and polyadenylation factor CLP1 P-loop [Lyophyllum shimeji]